MGNSTSRVVGCFVPVGNGKDGVNLEFLEPLDEGLGHSFCYVRPMIADSPAITPSNSERYTVDSSTFESETHSSSFRHEIVEELAGLRRPNKNIAETTFKTISGASVSANASTARTPTVFLTGDALEPAASFESTASFTAIPLQPVPRGSGPLNGFMSGPLERGFASGPLERGSGFMSGPLDRGAFMSGPLDSINRNIFSAPLGYGRKMGISGIMRSMSRPMRSVFSQTFSKRSYGPSWLQRFFLQSKEDKFRVEAQRNWGEDGPSEPKYSNSRNLQWAHGKAGEDRVHVVLSEEQGWLFVGIYDGFSGPDAPDFLMGNFYKAIDKELEGLLWDYDNKPQSNPSISGPMDSDKVEKEHENLKECDEGVVSVKMCEDEIRREPNADSILDNEPANVCKIIGEKENVIDLHQLQFAGEIRRDQGMNLIEDDASKTPVVNLAKACRKSRRLYELLEMELVENKEAKQSQLASTESTKREGTCCTEMPENLRENEGVFGEDSKYTEDKNTASFSALGRRQMIRRSLIGSKFRQMYRRRKSLRKKFFPWSYDWHREQQQVDERVISPSTVIRRCKPGPVDHEAVLRAIMRAFDSTEGAYMEMVEGSLDRNPELALMGSCVLVMLMKDQDVYVMNLGDSRVILAQDRLSDRYVSSYVEDDARHQNRSSSYVEDDARHQNRSRETLVRVELDRISEESPMHNPNTRVCNINKNKEISLCSLKIRALQLSTDHSTSIEEEVLRIKEEHPDDSQAVLNDRVKGQLKVTRAFGAGFLKKPKFNEALLEMFRIDYIGNSPYLSSIPSVLHHRLCSNDRFVVLSSDGLYQYFSNEEVISHVAWFIENVPEGDPAQYLIAELLFRAAKENGMDFHELLDIPHGDRRMYHDDVSVMVISLEGRIWRSSG